MHPYFIFKDLITIFLFLLVLSIIVFYYPNAMGQKIWPNIILLIVYVIFICAKCWEYNFYYNSLNIIKIYNKTINISGLIIIKIFCKYIIEKINPFIVRYYYKIYNQQITKIIKNSYNFYLLLVGISETIRTQQNNMIKYIKLSNKIDLLTDNHNNEISLEFIQ